MILQKVFISLGVLSLDEIYEVRPVSCCIDKIIIEIGERLMKNNSFP